MTLSAHHIETLRDQLRTLPDHYQHASHMLTSHTTDENNNRAPGKPGSLAPLNLAVVHALDTRHKPGWHGLDPTTDQVVIRYGTIPALEAWVRYIRERMTEDGVDHPDLSEQPTIHTETTWLLDTLTYALAQPWAHHLAHDVATLHKQLATLNSERPKYRPRCRAFGCGTTDRRGIHHGTILEPMDNATWYMCRACGRNYTLTADLQTLGQAPDMPGPDAAHLLGISPHTIRSWASRGIITHTTSDSQGRKLYNLHDIKQAATRLAATPQAG